MKKMLALCALALCVSGASAQTALKVNGQTISAADQKELMTLLQNQKGIQNKDEQLRMAREILVKEKIIGQAAWNQKLEKNPLVKRQIAESKAKIYQDALVHEYLNKHPVSSKDIQDMYEVLKRRYDPNQVQIRFIAVNSEKEAKDLVYLIEAGENMGKLAKKNSIDKASAKDEGLLPFTAVSQFRIPGFANALRSLKKGQLYKKPIKSGNMYQIFRLEDSRVVPFPPLDKIRNQVIGEAVQQKANAYIAGLYQKAKIGGLTSAVKPVKKRVESVIAPRK